MRERLLDYLCCPKSRESDLDLTVFTRDEDHIIDGVLYSEASGEYYSIVDGVPRMVPKVLYSNPGFEARHRSKLRAMGWKPPSLSEDNRFLGLKLITSQVYGFEWTHWDRHGWEHDGPPTEEEQQTFCYKSLLSGEELRGKAVLDAGCGNGRYAHTAAQFTKALIGLDLSAAVESAFKNLRDLPTTHVVQGDVLNPPIQDESLDHVYSIGVLMITGDCRGAIQALTKTLRPGGTITVHVYTPGFPVWQFCDKLVRSVTTKLSIPTLIAVSQRMSWVARFLDKHKLRGKANLLLRTWPEDIVNYDWYGTPEQTYHTYPEIRAWFKEMGYELVADNERKHEPGTSPLRRWWVNTVWPEQMATVRAHKPGERTDEQLNRGLQAGAGV